MVEIEPEIERGLDLFAYVGIVQAIEIISEASRRLPAELRDRHPSLPWRAIRDSGNFYHHQYDSVSESRLWAVVH